jgi:hypothetical protein
LLPLGFAALLLLWNSFDLKKELKLCFSCFPLKGKYNKILKTNKKSFLITYFAPKTTHLLFPPSNGQAYIKNKIKILLSIAGA